METKLLILPLIAFLISVVFNACGPIKEIHRNDPYEGPVFDGAKATMDQNLQTVVILASNEGTEIFDLMAPFEIFSLTNELNVVVLAPEKKILPLWKGIYLMPHMSLDEFDESGINPDLIVIPNIVDPDNEVITNWIRHHENSNNYLLSVCEGARVIGHSGIHSGSKLTTHHSSIAKIEKSYPELKWIRGLKFIEDEKLLSTSGVSAAVEGSLMAIERLLDEEKRIEVMEKISYPHHDIQLSLNDSHMRFGDVLKILTKTGFTKNKNIGVYASDNVSELELSAVIDSYNRTLPARLETISNKKFITTRNGLFLIPSTTINSSEFDEVIVPGSGYSEDEDSELLQRLDMQTELTFLDPDGYVFHKVYHELRKSHSKNFTRTVYRLLDYNVDEEIDLIK